LKAVNQTEAVEVADEVKLNAFYILLLNDIKLLELAENDTFLSKNPPVLRLHLIYVDAIIIFFVLFCCDNRMVFSF
jgi:hypothetical protein